MGNFCHSLGSVIVYKGLQYSPEHWAWFLDQRRVQSFAKRFLVSMPGSISLSTVDIPKRPLYLENSASAVNRSELFSKFVGVVSYGSPIETFAKLWPKLIENLDNLCYFREFKWVNLYDIRDFISSPILSANIRKSGNVANIPVDSHWLIFKAHTEYLRKTERNREISYALFRWFIDNDDSELEEIAKKKNNIRSNRNVFSLLFQAAIVLAIGIAILPLATAALFSLIGSILGPILSSVLKIGDNYLPRILNDLNPFAEGTPDIHVYILCCGAEVAVFIFLLIVAGLLRRVIKLLSGRSSSS